MTDTIDAPAAVKPINHWISGGPSAGTSGSNTGVCSCGFAKCCGISFG